MEKETPQENTAPKKKVSRVATRVLPQHRKVLEELMKPENKNQMGKALVAAEYSPSSARSPASITGTKSWQNLMDEYLPESLLALRHKELLNKRNKRLVTERVRMRNGRYKIRHYYEDDGPDTAAVKGGLEMAYKLRGSFVPEIKPPEANVHVYNLFYKPEVRQNVKLFEDQLKQSIANEFNNKDKGVVHEAEYSDTSEGEVGPNDAGGIADASSKA